MISEEGKKDLCVRIESEIIFKNSNLITDIKTVGDVPNLHPSIDRDYLSCTSNKSKSYGAPKDFSNYREHVDETSYIYGRGCDITPTNLYTYAVFLGCTLPFKKFHDKCRINTIKISESKYVGANIFEFTKIGLNLIEHWIIGTKSIGRINKRILEITYNSELKIGEELNPRPSDLLEIGLEI